MESFHIGAVENIEQWEQGEPDNKQFLVNCPPVAKLVSTNNFSFLQGVLADLMFKHRCLNIEAQNEQAISIIMPQASGVEGDGHHPPTDGAPCTTQRVTGQNKHSNSPSGGLTPPNLGHAKLGLFFRVKNHSAANLRQMTRMSSGGEERRGACQLGSTNPLLFKLPSNELSVPF